MAFSLVNHFVLDIKELRVPFLLMDAAVVYGFYRWDSTLKAEQKKLDDNRAKQAGVQHETEKRDKKALKAAERAARKATDKRTHNTTGKMANFAPSNNIMQPDKSRKLK